MFGTILATILNFYHLKTNLQKVPISNVSGFQNPTVLQKSLYEIDVVQLTASSRWTTCIFIESVFAVGVWITDSSVIKMYRSGRIAKWSWLKNDAISWPE